MNMAVLGILMVAFVVIVPRIFVEWVYHRFLKSAEQ